MKILFVGNYLVYKKTNKLISCSICKVSSSFTGKSSFVPSFIPSVSSLYAQVPFLPELSFDPVNAPRPQIFKVEGSLSSGLKYPSRNLCKPFHESPHLQREYSSTHHFSGFNGIPLYLEREEKRSAKYALYQKPSCTHLSLLRILTVFDCGRGVSKERESVYAVWNVPAE